MALIAALSAFFGTLPGRFKGYTYLLNTAYGEHSRQVVDIVLPKEKGETGLVLMIHGGAWIAGDKESYLSALTYCADLGYAGAALNYRYISENTDVSDILDDINSALAVIRAKSAEKGFAISKVLLTGASAGAHLSLLYAYSRAETAPVKPVAVVSNCGPTDLTDPGYYQGNALGDLNNMLKLMGYLTGVDITADEFTSKSGSYEAFEKKLLEYSPVSYVNSATVPTVINHGDSDTVVPYRNAVELDALLTENSVPHDFVTYRNADHDLSGDNDAAEKSQELLLKYAKTYLN